jgi:hypothetical protein
VEVVVVVQIKMLLAVVQMQQVPVLLLLELVHH